MSTFLRRFAMVVGGSGVYATSVFLGYQYYHFTGGLLAGEDKETSHRDVGFSYVMNPKRVQRFQDIAKSYDSQIGRDEFFMGINYLRRALLYFHAKGTVLEVGAGTGRNLNYYPSAVDRVVLSDSSDQMLLRARQKLRILPASERSRFACLETDAAKLNFPESCFDTVVDTFGLCSYDDPVCVLKEMARVCKPDGKILLLEHGRSKTWHRLTQYLDDNCERHAKNWGCVWNRDLDEILEQANLEVDRVHTWHFGTTYYVVCRPVKEKNINELATS